MVLVLAKVVIVVIVVGMVVADVKVLLIPRVIVTGIYLLHSELAPDELQFLIHFLLNTGILVLEQMRRQDHAAFGAIWRMLASCKMHTQQWHGSRSNWRKEVGRHRRYPNICCVVVAPQSACRTFAFRARLSSSCAQGSRTAILPQCCAARVVGSSSIGDGAAMCDLHVLCGPSETGMCRILASKSALAYT